MFHFHLQHLRSVCIRGKALGKARTADPQYFAARRQQRQLIALAGRDARFVHPLAQPVVYTSPRRAVDISRLAGAQDKTSIQPSYSSIIRLIF